MIDANVKPCPKCGNTGTVVTWEEGYQWGHCPICCYRDRLNSFNFQPYIEKLRDEKTRLGNELKIAQNRIAELYDRFGLDE